MVQLTKEYGAVTAVDAVNLQISRRLLLPARTVRLGKTSTLRMVAGHDSATSGDILVGRRVTGPATGRAQNATICFSRYALFPHFSVIDDVPLP